MSTDLTTAPPAFTLTDRYRERLTTIAEPYHDARGSGHDERAEELAEQLYDAPWGIGGGSGRTVLPIPVTEYTGGDYDEYVVKLATPSPQDEWAGTAQNTREARLWDPDTDPHLSSTARDALVPVIDSDPDGYWLIMPRGDPYFTPHQDFHEWRSDTEYHLNAIVMQEDIDEENTVLLNGEYKLCDYGVPANGDE